jgi:hypothetical protein
MPKYQTTTKSKSKYHKSKNKKPAIISTSNRLANLLNTISNNRNTMTKSDINLPARLIYNRNNSSKPLEYSKSVSSTFTSSMHNGQVHSTGKEVINDSTKPFIQVAELHNDQVAHYMIPRKQSSLAYPSKSKKTKKLTPIKKTRKR